MTGWDTSLEHVLRARGTDLLRYGYVLCGERTEAERLLADALVRTFAVGRHTLDPEVAEAYVRRAMLQLYVDGSRRRRWLAAVRRLVTGDERREPRSSDDGGLELALATLSPRQRACVVLCYFEDRSTTSVADALGLSVGAVHRHLGAGLARLASSGDVELPESDALRDDLDLFSLATAR